MEIKEISSILQLQGIIVTLHQDLNEVRFLKADIPRRFLSGSICYPAFESISTHVSQYPCILLLSTLNCFLIVSGIDSNTLPMWCIQTNHRGPVYSPNLYGQVELNTLWKLPNTLRIKFKILNMALWGLQNWGLCQTLQPYILPMFRASPNLSS